MSNEKRRRPASRASGTKTERTSRSKSAKSAKGVKSSAKAKEPSTTRKITRTRRAPAPKIIKATEVPTEQQIAERAYQLFEERGYLHGFHEQDWLQAERELLGGL